MLKKEALATIEQTIGYHFKDKQLISQAFTRSSYHYEHPEEQSNEVMEFVGDSVLSLLVVDTQLNKKQTHFTKDKICSNVECVFSFVFSSFHFVFLQVFGLIKNSVKIEIIKKARLPEQKP